MVGADWLVDGIWGEHMPAEPANALQVVVSRLRRAVAPDHWLVHGGALAGRAVTVETVAREAGVSRSWLYGQADLRVEIERLRSRGRPSGSAPPVPARQRASDASLRRRLEAVNAEIRRLREENRQLREQLGVAFGELRAVKQLDRRKPTMSGPCS